MGSILPLLCVDERVTWKNGLYILFIFQDFRSLTYISVDIDWEGMVNREEVEEDIRRQMKLI